jgi:dual specificity protein kinase YAK1
MANRAAFIDFAQGLLNLNPLERWTPNQAKLHPFITQAKFTGPFVPPMTLRTGSNKSPAPGVQEQQRAEALSKQRQQQQQQQQAAQAQAQSAAYASMQMNQFAQSPLAQQPPQNMYNMYTPGGHQAAAPPPYNQQPQAAYQQSPMGMIPQQAPRYQPQQQAQPSNLYTQAATRASRQRATTLEQHQTGIPAALQRVMGHLDPNAPIRLQPSPAYYPPPPDGAPDSAGGQRRRGSRAGNGNSNNGQRSNRDFIRNLEDRTLEEGFMNANSNHWQ